MSLLNMIFLTLNDAIFLIWFLGIRYTTQNIYKTIVLSCFLIVSGTGIVTSLGILYYLRTRDITLFGSKYSEKKPLDFFKE